MLEIDINESTLNDALKQCATDERNIKEMLVQEERESRIKELQSQFTAVPRDYIIQILASVKWDVEAAILPLFNNLDKFQKVQEDELKRQADLRQSQMPRPEDKVQLRIFIVNLPRLKSKQSKLLQNHLLSKKMWSFLPQVSSNFLNYFSFVLESKQTVTLKATPAQVDVRNQITVEWELTSGQSSPYDWVGLFQREQTNKNYLTYQWRTTNPNGGTINFTAPTTYGVYEFRYIPYGSYQHIAISNPITVGNSPFMIQLFMIYRT